MLFRQWGSIAPIHTKIIYDLTISIINKCFEFQNDCLKIIRIRYNCTQFCRIPLWQKNQKYKTTSEFLERYAPKSNQHQIYQGATRYKISSILAHCSWDTNIF